MTTQQVQYIRLVQEEITRLSSAGNLRTAYKAPIIDIAYYEKEGFSPENTAKIYLGIEPVPDGAKK